jgi:hypothetical protein
MTLTDLVFGGLATLTSAMVCILGVHLLLAVAHPPLDDDDDVG